MAELVIQEGQGERRPLVIAYHTSADYLRGVHPTAAIWSFYGPEHNGGAVRPLGELVGRARAQGFEPDPLVLVGWSKGVQNVRTHLNEGTEARAQVDGVVSLDGAHADTGFVDESDVEPWEWAANQAEDGQLAFTWTTSRVPAFDYESTRAVAERVLGPIQDGTRDTGSFRLIATPGGGEEEHVRHAAMAKTEVPRVIELAKQNGARVGRLLGAALGAALGGVAGGAWKGTEGAAVGAVAGGALGAFLGGL